ncbi:MAG: 3-hydroxyacyl-CoA dehydrogenase [Pseudomonadota bacterium]|nr:3-hydroxyacyl-CoA dehydrogenase [Pseudomonadota bacterium]
MADRISPAGPVTIVGAGSIGMAWAIVFARAGFVVRVHDTEPDRLTDTAGRIAERLADMAAWDLLNEPDTAIAARIHPTVDLAESLHGAVYVQECVPEDRALKRCVFAKLDQLAPSNAILASSSSAIPISQLTAEIEGKDRCLTVHPGNPPYLIPIAEIVPGPFTAQTCMDAAQTLLEAAGMTPIRVAREIEGFVFNRLQGALLREAYCLVRDGIAAVDDIDTVVRDGLGPRWSIIGPFETADLNTRGGIAAHAALLGPAYARMGAERGQRDPWTNDLVEQVTNSRRRQLPLDQWAERVAWRDRELMALASFRRNRTGGDTDG